MPAGSQSPNWTSRGTASSCSSGSALVRLWHGSRRDRCRRTCARRRRRDAVSTARWLIEPLSVTSPLSIDGGSASTRARATRLALPVPVAVQHVDQALEEGAQLRRRPSTCCAGASAGSSAKRAAGVEAREDQHADLAAVDAGDHHVLHQRVAGGDDLRAQRPDRDEGAGGELEVLGDAAVEHEAARRDRPGPSA